MTDTDLITYVCCGLTTVVVAVAWGAQSFRLWYGRNRLRLEMPALAARLGLRYFSNAAVVGLGTWGGVVRGHHLLLVPDEGRVRAWLGREAPLTLEEYDNRQPPAAGQLAFRSSSKAFNDRFAKRHAAADVARRLTAPGREIDRLTSFLTRHRGGRLQVRGEKVNYRPLGDRDPKFIPMRGLAQRLEDFVDFLCALDALLASTQAESKTYQLCAHCGGVCERREDGDGHHACDECDEYPDGG